MGEEAARVIYWNREKEREEEEQVCAGGALRWLYGTRGGKAAARILARPWASKVAGIYQSSSLSRLRIRSFVRRFGISMDDFEDVPYRSFNDFFTRRFKPGRRSFADDPAALPAFAEGRYLAYEASGGRGYPVKGTAVTPAELLGRREEASRFAGGPLVIARLCPTDYHRFHYPDDGTTLQRYRIAGLLHSVNPIALRANPDILISNERRVSLLETVHFGVLAYVEVGAMNVGRIVETHPPDRPFRRGDEKGCFLFGGSSIILLGEPAHWMPCQDLLERTARGQEVFVRLGDRIGERR